MWKRLLVGPLTVGMLAAGAATGQAAVPVHSTEGNTGPTMGSMNMGSMSGTPLVPNSSAAAGSMKFDAKATYLVARLKGRNEIPVPGGPAVGDPNGKALAVIKVKGSVVSYAANWSGVTAPTMLHIHQGRAGVNGPVKVGLATTAMPATATAAAGAVNVPDVATLNNLRAHPSDFYVNIHTQKFPTGALRGQLTPLKRPVDLMRMVRTGKLHAFMDGGQEVPVPGKPPVGDPRGFARGFINARKTTVDYSFTWVGINSPTMGHIHQGRTGVNGEVKVPLFSTPVPASVFAISGTVNGVDAGLVRRINSHPGNFYTNLHTAEFPGGAVRGQLSKSARHWKD